MLHNPVLIKTQCNAEKKIVATTHVNEVVNWSLSGSRILAEEANERGHCQTPVGDLLLLVLLVQGALGHSEGVEEPATCST